MSSLKEKAHYLPQITLCAEQQPEIVLNVKFGGIEVKQILVTLDKLEFKAANPKDRPQIEFTFTDIE